MRLPVKTAHLLALAALAAGCYTAPSYPRDEDAGPSVFKIDVAKVIDVREAKKVAGVADDPTIPDSITKEYTATGWVADYLGDETVIMTAGHVCDASGAFPTEAFGDLPIVEVRYDIRSADGRIKAPAHVLRDDDTDDLCALAVDGNVGSPIGIASDDPPYGATVHYIGAPDGLWGSVDGDARGSTIRPIFAGTYAGRGGFWDAKRPVLGVMATFYPGASGSPVLYGGRVVGLFTATSAEFMGFGTAVPWDVVRDFMAQVRR